MGITGSLYSGLSGLSATSDALNVTSDNIANLNTVGYRRSRVLFEDVLSRSLIGVGELGAGVRIASIEQVFSQGSILPSARSTDMAITGKGFFIVNGSHAGVQGDWYTRAGNIGIDNRGFLVNPEGLRVQGYNADANGVIGTSVGDMRIEPLSLPPLATENLGMTLNLDSRATAINRATVPLDPLDDTTYHYTSSITVYDSRGAAHQVTTYFSFVDDGFGVQNWEYASYVDGAEVVGGTPGTPTQVAGGTLTFNPQGGFDTQTPTAGFTADWINADPETLNIDLSSSNSFAQDFSLNSQTQDGYPPGDLQDIEITVSGILNGLYSNGQSRSIGRVALANFRSEQGLERVGGSLFAATQDSGDPLVGFAATGGRGGIKGSALEQSNVEITEEFVNLITQQRGYQAATRTITTADELTQETLNLKR